MDISSLTFQQMLRPGSDLKGCTVAERCSIDFLINQRSLLDTLVTAGSDHADYMSCFVKGFCEANSRNGKWTCPPVRVPRVRRHQLWRLFSACQSNR